MVRSGHQARTLLDQPHRQHRIVHGQDQRAGMAEVEPVEQLGPRDVAEDHAEALAPRRRRPRRCSNRPRHRAGRGAASISATSRPTRPKPMITARGSSLASGAMPARRRPRMSTRRAAIAAEPGEQRREGQADRGDDLPEGGGLGADQLRGRGRARARSGWFPTARPSAGRSRPRPPRARPSSRSSSAGDQRLDAAPRRPAPAAGSASWRRSARGRRSSRR